ncbi:DUF5107 domain-containing protein [Mucilaginibacter sp. PAMB04274]|uniref:DUF5107 domain-containing protein n=1 Tax=Mucilaginibacter sp. PAMB04274 TaxID=3138568 RepID=UPI0031F67F2F
MNNSTVQAWVETVIIPTYEVGAPDKNPMFFEKRVYQGSSGVVYPNPVIEKIFDEKVDKPYQAIFLENQYLKIMILPELGGRVQMAWDKVKERHFIYYNQVIKPALVGLCGPWISGGIEFNWPQHHRPSTYEPVDFSIEENADGSTTVWVNEIEKMFRTKGMAGFTLHPDKAYLEIKAKLYNRTNMPQTFLWWANPAVAVNDDYQSVFPPDVNAVFDHGKRDVSAFPIATGTYYKVDYSPGTDISRYKNIKVPTSYMAVNSDYNFVGGYEHDTRAGVLHVANHHVSPGKKQWTWGCGDFGVAWDRNLTDEDGPYIELMTGVFTDNQPDFSWLMPYEEKSFTQYFMPYRELGMVKNASKDIMLSADIKDSRLTVKLFATCKLSNISVIIAVRGCEIAREVISISPEIVFDQSYEVDAECREMDLLISITDVYNSEMLRYDPANNRNNDIPEPAKPALTPQETESTEQLFLTGQHLDQYRHATYSPVPYYEEALKRDPADYRNNNALGAWYLRRGQFKKSENYFRTAIATITGRNPNPYDSEAYYNLGLCLKYQNHINEAYNAFFKSTWSSTWQDAGYFSVAQIDMIRSHHELALEHINWAIDRNARNGKAHALKICALRKLGRITEAMEAAYSALKRDYFNVGARYELVQCYLQNGQLNEADKELTEIEVTSRLTANTLLEYAIDYAAMGEYKLAVELLQLTKDDLRTPMTFYYIGYYAELLGNATLSATSLKQAQMADSAYCFPNKLEDILVLTYALEVNPADAKAAFYMGNLWYDKRQYDEAIAAWEKSMASEDQFSIVLRNLAIAYFNKKGKYAEALTLFEQAFALNPADARVLMELDQLYKRLNVAPQKRLNHLTCNNAVANLRDDLYLEIAALHNFLGQPEKANQLISNRKFHPWEGGEGRVSGQYIYSLVEIAKKQISSGDYRGAIENLTLAQSYPDNLGEGKLHGAQENDIYYWLGCAYEQLNENEEAQLYFKKASTGLSEPSAAMFYNDQQPDKIFYQGMAWIKLGERDKAQTIFNRLVNYGREHRHDEITLDYFAVSLPNLLIFDDDLNLRNKLHCDYITGLGLLGLGNTTEASSLLRNVLKEDAMHFGAKTHLDLLYTTNAESTIK